jgi:Leucine-rich repeat (LRR) protein
LWDGIGCDDADDKVVSIRLPKSDLLASIPTEFSLLPALAVVDLRQNMLFGSIPSQFSSITSLTSVDLEGNRLEGDLPRFGSQNLTYLDLSHNQLHKKIPADFGENLVSLTYIDLQYNLFTGFLPFGLEDLPRLETISLSFNQLSGTLPHYLQGMSNLKYLYLDHNHLVGTIPPSLGQTSSSPNNTIVSLQEVWLQNNLLSGSIPNSLANASELRDLFLDGNKLTGTVPAALCRESINEDFFADAAIIDRDLCDSVTCRANTVSDEGVYPCRRCTSTAQNPYLGRKGECDNLTEARIVDMILGKGGVTALKSACDYDGVVCNDDKKVTRIKARGRGLSGTLPDELGFLTYLTELDVSDNSFTGFFPSGLRFANLTALYIGGNKLKGIVPPLMCEKADQINGDESGDCTSIACPMGTFSRNGRGFGDCIPCHGYAMYLGSTSCNPAPEPTAPPSTNHSSGRKAGATLAALFVAGTFLVAVLGTVLVRRLDRARRKRLRSWSIKGLAISAETASVSFPHSEEIKSMVSTIQNGRKNRNSSGTKWLQNHLNRSYNYIISLAETEAVKDPPGMKSTNVTGGEIDDYGWKERGSIIMHRDLENIVQAQKDNGSLEVWEYPDPLERPVSYSTSSSVDEEDALIDDDDDDLSEWIRRQQNDPSTREVWLDVPRVE